MTPSSPQGDFAAKLPDDGVANPPMPARTRSPLARLPIIQPPEFFFSRIAFAGVAVVLTVVYFVMLHGFWAPASPLFDQNAYEMGGRQFAQSFTTGVKPVNDFVYVCAMYVRSADGTYYPKYPLGMSILYACALWIGKWAAVRHGGTEWAFLLAPVSAAASTLGIYLFLSRIASGFASMLGTLLLSFSPLALVLVNEHWSHHPAMAVAIWGMYFLLTWWQQDGGWRGLLAGLLLGFAVLVRYTEGLLLLPLVFVVLNKVAYRSRTELPRTSMIAWALIAALAIGLDGALPAGHGAYLWTAGVAAGAIFVLCVLGLHHFRPSAIVTGWPEVVVAAALLIACGVVGSAALPVPHVNNVAALIVLKAIFVGSALLLFTVQWSAWRTLVRVGWPVVGWLIPVLYLVLFNKLKMGSWTGYDTTNESTGFTWQQLRDNWEYIFKQLDGTAIFFYLPVAVLGLGMVFRRNWRLGTLLALWLVPNLVTYGCYYWGANLPAMLVPVLFYFRFFLTCLPPLSVCAALLIDDLLRRDGRTLEVAGETTRRRTIQMAAAVAVVGIAAGVAFHLLAPQLRPENAVLTGVLAALAVAALFEVGRGVAGPIAAGAVVAFAAGVSLYDNRGALDRDFVINANLYDVGLNVVDRVTAADMKKSPLLFTDELGPINYLQFAGNFECYPRDAFTARWTRGAGHASANTPSPEQSARQEYAAGVYQNKTDADLLKMQNDVMASALRDGRRVLVVLPAAALNGFVRTFVTPAQFKVKSTWKWREPAEMSAEGRRAMINFGLIGSMMMGHGTPQNWAMAEIVLK